MRQKKEKNIIRNDRSTINPDFFTNQEESTIGIYGFQNSRTVYVETGYGENRALVKYFIEPPKGFFSSDEGVHWKKSPEETSVETAANIRQLRDKSHTVKELQVSNEDIRLFQIFMDDAVKKDGMLEHEMLSGSHDEDIKMALKRIGHEIEFQATSSSCVIL